jgi:hypothetical protein
LKRQERQRLTVAIEHSASSVHTIKKRLGQHLSQQFNRSIIKAYRAEHGLFFRPSSYHVQDVELEEYLGTYDCIYSEGLSLKEVILKIGLGKEKRILRADKPEAKAVFQKYQTHLLKAKKIIRNVEDGEFPGGY